MVFHHLICIREKTNVGFSYLLLILGLLYKIDEKFGFLWMAMALAAPQGRAEDILIAATYKISRILAFAQDTEFLKEVRIMMKSIILLCFITLL